MIEPQNIFNFINPFVLILYAPCFCYITKAFPDDNDWLTLKWLRRSSVASSLCWRPRPQPRIRRRTSSAVSFVEQSSVRSAACMVTSTVTRTSASRARLARKLSAQSNYSVNTSRSIRAQPILISAESVGSNLIDKASWSTIQKRIMRRKSSSNVRFARRASTRSQTWRLT